jgi:hypothetical protein
MKGKTIIIIVVCVVVAIILFFVIRAAIIYAKKKKAQRLFESSYVSGTYGTGGTAVIANLGTTAATIYDAFYNYWGGMSEDEETAIVALSNIPKANIPALSDIYFQLYAKNLREDFVKYLDAAEFKRVQTLLG